jgi:molybdenum cofactor guanylyltransferase
MKKKSHSTINKLPRLLGVVACGGESSRMGTDKSLIEYHPGIPQRYFLYEMLSIFCDEVVISCNKTQSSVIKSGYNLICDHERFAGHGPISGLMSVFEANPNRSVLFLGCDYPFISVSDIRLLTDHRDDNYSCVAYDDIEGNIIDPMIAIFENRCHQELISRFDAGEYSLRDYLDKSTTLLLKPRHTGHLKSVDTEAERVGLTAFNI